MLQTAEPGLIAHAETPSTKKVYLETYGCQMNEYDSGLVRKILSESYSPVETPAEADLILLNTCAIREKAHEKVYSRLESFQSLKKRKSDLRIGILGCMAQNLGEDLFAMGLPLDFIAGPDSYKRLPEMIAGLPAGGKRIDTRLSIDENYEDVQPVVREGILSYVTIMRGCDNFCSFCVVPYTRGRERSRSSATIISEIKNLVEQGVKEVTLLGQNVNSYSHESEKIRFSGLIERILKETEITRIRFTSPHPHDFPEELLKLMASEERFCSQVHLPLQSGSSSVLERMKRDYNRDEYLKLVDRIRTIVPGVSITSDIIVGFCGETEEEFQDTISLVNSVQFDLAYMFRYSERELTLAKRKYADDVPESVKLARLDQLITLQTGIAAERNRAEIGSVHRVLVEGVSRRSELDLRGRTETGKTVIFKAFRGISPGDMLSVRITDSSSATLKGDPIV